MRQLPSAIESEQAFLAACLTGAAAEAIEMVGADDFYGNGNRYVFEAVEQLVKSQAEVGLVTVIERMKNNQTLAKAGGASGVSRLTDAICGARLESIADIIKRSATRRRVIEACNKTMAECFASDDIDEILGNHTQELSVIENRLSNGSWIPFRDLAQPMIEFWETNKGKTITGILSGFYEIDRMLGGFQPGNLIVIGARPSMGKTAMAVKIARNAAEYGFPVGIRSIEMSMGQIFTRTTSDMASVDSDHFRLGTMQDYHWERIVDAVAKLHDLPIWIDDKPTEHVRALQRNIRQFCKRHGKCLVLIDYLQYIDGLKSDRKDLEIGTVTRGLKASARENNIPIVLLAQLNRNLEARDDKRPRKSDLRGSGEIEQDADVICFLYRDEVYNADTDLKGVGEFIISKNRDGKVGTVPLAWVAHRATFENLARTDVTNTTNN